jgi:hypothetical protein
MDKGTTNAIQGQIPQVVRSLDERAQTVAYWMYRKRGWRVLVENTQFPVIARPYQIMGLGLARSQDSNTVFQGCNKADTSG